MTSYKKSRSTTVFKNKPMGQELYVHEDHEGTQLMAMGPYSQTIMYEVTAADLINIGSALLNIGRRIQEKKNG